MLKGVRTQKCGMQAKSFLQSTSSDGAAAATGPVLATLTTYQADASVLNRPLLAFPPSFEVRA